MITITNLSKNFTNRTLFNDVSISIYPNEKIGLTGPNGAGKTTLFSIIRGEMEATGGEVQIQKNLNIGYLPQETSFRSDRTVIEELTSGDDRMIVLKKEKRKLEDENRADSMRYGDVLDELEQLGVYDLEHRAEKILSGLGFHERDFNKPVCHLSGGWQMRTLLAKLLTYQYDLLLLDEPTNYLDLNATLWLKDFLSHYQGTFVIISHDKIFLDDVTNYNIVLENARIVKVKGNYSDYEESKVQEEATLEKKQRIIEKKKQQLERFCDRFHAQPNRASAVRNKRKMIERMETVEIEGRRKSIKGFEFSDTKRSAYNVITLENVSKSYGETNVYQGLDFEIIRGQKVCLVGENGAGKSTLLKMLAGVLDIDQGNRRVGQNVDIGYFSQTRLDVLNPNRTVLEEVSVTSQGRVRAQEVRSLLGLFNFHGDDVFKTIRILSGGEKSRVILAKLLIDPPNFILLDEPTTHLDIDGVEALTKAFRAYEGTLCFISHDLFFVKQIADHIVEVNYGQLKQFHGRLDYYLEKRGLIDEKLAQDKKKIKHEKKKETKQNKEQEKSSSVVEQLHKKHKEALNKIANNKKEIKELEKEKQELETESYVKARVLSDPHSQRDGETLKSYGKRLKFIHQRIREIESLIERLIKENREINS
ncbi:MAG: ABC-F family ATP-binding cassette domain-containing protein [Candidatus Omnitrophica bacterium]|nr:ABC-F family ATP-binding cassette domain-containing protein [Candidatus Omnitrophota bacterium]